MNFLTIVLIGVLALTTAAKLRRRRLVRAGRKRAQGGLKTCAHYLMLIGTAGFLCTVLSIIGALDWLPSSFEWPVGYSGKVIAMPGGGLLVPHTPSGRVQVYDAAGRFMRGWRVHTRGGSFKTALSDRAVEIYTARGQRRLRYSLDGRPLGETSYAPLEYDSIPPSGSGRIIPTTLWLWPFSHPFWCWALIIVGIVLAIRGDKRRERSPSIGESGELLGETP